MDRGVTKSIKEGVKMIQKFKDMSDEAIYKTMSNTIFPRPVAWISSEDEGIVNLAPFSYFTPLSSNPPLVVVSIGHKEDGMPKDTMANILKHKKCTISFAHKELLEDMKNSAEALPKELSEAEHFNIKMQTVLDDFPPMVAKAKSALFCEFFQAPNLGSKTQPLILKVMEVYIDDLHVDENDKINLENIGRVGMEYLIDSTRIK